MASGADIIALQEVYAPTQQAQLAKLLHDAYPHCAYSPTRCLRPFGAALMIFSKYPLVATRHILFDQVPFDEQICVDKGMIIASVDIPQLGALTIANTHHTSGGALWNPEGGLAKRVRSRQYEQLFGVLDAHGGVNRLALGDFNAGPEATYDNYAELIAGKYADAWTMKNGDASRPTWDVKNILNAHGPHQRTSSQRLDHILPHQELLRRVSISRAQLMFSEPVVPLADGRKVTVSDHYGVMVELQIV